MHLFAPDRPETVFPADSRSIAQAGAVVKHLLSLCQKIIKKLESGLAFINTPCYTLHENRIEHPVPSDMGRIIGKQVRCLYDLVTVCGERFAIAVKRQPLALWGWEGGGA